MFGAQTHLPPHLEPPVAGVILAELSVVATGGAQRIDMASERTSSRPRLHVVIPAGAYPAGTKVTARLVGELPMPISSCIVLSRLLSAWTSDDAVALQILPDATPPAVPLRVELELEVDRWAYQVLHAKVGDAAWTAVETFVPPANRLSFSVPEPGLWTIGQLHFPPSFQGRLQRTEITCSNGEVIANDPPVIVDIDGDAFTWAQASPGISCYKVGTGKIIWECPANWLPQRFTFAPNLGERIYIDSSQVDDAGTGIWWQRATSSSECGTQAIEREHYIWQGTDRPALVALSDAGTCPTGTAKDGGRD